MASIEERKADHIDICLKRNVSVRYKYWNDIRLIHEALPEVDYDEIDTTSYVLGKKLDFPFIVTAITGGFDVAKKINANIAEACAELQIGMGVGSERAAIEGVDEESYSIIKDYDVPLVIGNIGAPQLIDQKDKKRFTVDDVIAAKEIVNADFMAIHLNYLHELIQPEGDLKSKGCFDAITSLAREFPIIVKETGAGISQKTVQRLSGIGVKAVDIGGAGGTSFPAIEMYRSKNSNNYIKRRLGRTYFDWGIPATVSLMSIKTNIPLIASGGILNGLDIARSIALGAVCAGGAYAMLHEAVKSAEAVKNILKIMKEELKVAMMLTGSSNVKELSQADYIVLGKTKQWVGGQT
ncbi:MAG: type 2 isopentenyl-diphosphate Delta-isomerase [archaeon]|nr:type 2 isopentenyl-diphosphate Delta-isomerase [archaeon]